jgi:PST family polysaccharide transporter
MKGAPEMVRQWAKAIIGHVRSGLSTSAIRASLNSVLLTVSRVLSSLVFNKVVAVYFGPTGLALVGQFQSFTAIAFGVTTGNVTSGVVSLVASEQSDERRRRAVSTAVLSFSGGTALAAVMIGLFSDWLSLATFNTPDYATVFQVFALLMIPLIINVVVVAAAAGLGFTSAYITINALTALMLVPVAWVMIQRHGLVGALLSAALTNALAIGITALWFLKWRPFPYTWFVSRPDTALAARLLKLTLLTVSTIVLIPLAQFFVRAFIIRDAGVESAGQWQAALKMGEIVLMIGTILISVYLLPTFAAARQDLGLKALRLAVMLVGALMVLAAIVALMAEMLLPVLFSPEFLAAQVLLPFQLAGDVLRVGAMVVQAAFLVRLDARSYIAVDLVFTSSLLVSAWLLIPSSGAQGAAMAALIAGGLAFFVAVCVAAQRDRW